ncbi:MAG: NAD-dependent DNA ligase LigA [Muribaculaceae bacterium]|nr:NAD-dependent DNA ligase LigA [Muribaculaceae bacterium]
MMDLFKQRIDQLRRELNEHNHRYYVLNAPTISDQEYDHLLRELEDLERDYPQYADPLSPTQRVGSDITKGFEQVTHERPMMSLANSYSIEEVQDFLRRAREGLGGEQCEIVGELKYDGTSISITYDDGRLTRAVTRGDGTRGDDVTANVKTIRSVPLTLPEDGDWPRHFEVRGEILLPWERFDALNRERQEQEEPLFANPRNAAAGTLKLQNSAEVARRGLDAVFYFLLGDNLPFATHHESIDALKRWGFKTGMLSRLDDIDHIADFIAHWDEERRHLPVATDGLVFKIDNLRQQLNLGSTAKSPRWAIAYKFAPERECTLLKSVSFEVGRTGVITPVANLEPVLLSGTIVKRASLHNADIIEQLDIRDGDHVFVEKGGEIIPKIVGVDLKQRPAGAKPVQFVSHCPECGTPLRRDDGEAAWVCPNSRGCAPQIVGRIEHFVSRHAMNIDGVGSEAAAQLHAAGLVNDPADLYDLTEAQLVALDRWQQRSARRLLQGLEQSRGVPFARVLFALSIPNVGETTARQLTATVHDIDTLMAMSAEQLATIPDVGKVIADGIVEFFADPLNRTLVERLRAAGLQLALTAEETAGRTDRLAGKKIVISGTFSRHSREEYKAMIEQHGGKNVSSISGATSMVLAGENMGPAKLEKARRLSIDIIDEDTFLKMLDS